MVFVYITLLALLIFSWRSKESLVKKVWIVAFIALLLSVAVFICHAMTPLEVHL